MVKPNLDKVVAPYRRRVQDLDEKIVKRTSLLSELLEHQEKGTVPKAIAVPRMPQCPSSQEESFREKFKVLTERYCKDAIQLLLDARADDVKEMNGERKDIFKEATVKVEEALHHAYNLIPDLTDERVKDFQDQLHGQTPRRYGEVQDEV
ncbi:hypothetical protein BWQ96_00576 [Gracilariopsis chorda]|uniref:Uncharacterized protein n=1 Tax=Gracilariopsis chorda TaxID=448386 RepID=A0A2V3J5J1_9FLOR|nr:hypothetical protein BWQ96_00576 [Gracilariopsis chorda]|eukprot:PXF49698.1 hypothetical protein BWQ96_00576 [Gracilariopsis chorda]